MIPHRELSNEDAQRYSRLLCEHCRAKKKIGTLLSQVTAAANYSLEESASFIHDIVTYDFFLDIPGEIDGFYRKLQPPQLKDRLLALLSASRHLNSRNEIVDSDEDSTGNLK